MRLNAFTDYCLRVLMLLAAQPQRRVTVGAVATSFGINRNHLTKVVHFLGREGWVLTVRGKGGGLSLAQAPGDIVIGEVVRRAEGADRPAECFEPGTPACLLARGCRLRGVLQEATTAFHDVLDGCTLADLVPSRRATAALWAMPPQAAR